MAITYWQNQRAHDIILPTYEGSSIVVRPYYFVVDNTGTYFSTAFGLTSVASSAVSEDKTAYTLNPKTYAEVDETTGGGSLGDMEGTSLTITNPDSGIATLGPELLTNPSFDTDLTGWTAGAGWVWEAGGAKHTAGSGVAKLEQSVTVDANVEFNLSLVMSGRTAGSINVRVAGSEQYSAGSKVITASMDSVTSMFGGPGPVLLSITPTSDFDGILESVTLKIANSSLSYLSKYGADTWAHNEMRSPYTSLFIGPNAGQLWMTGAYAGNTGLGSGALRNIRSGTYNTAVGVNAYTNLVSGSYNSAVGQAANFYLTSGSNNVAVGVSALMNGSTGSYNTAVGKSAGRSATTPSFNSFFGAESGYKSGATPATANGVTTGSNLTFLGYQAGLGSATQRTNATAIGYQAYVDADNTVVLGDENVTDIFAGSTALANVKAGSVQLTTGARPAADAAHRGMIWYVAGGTGVADTIEICVKSAANTYSWVALATA